MVRNQKADKYNEKRRYKVYAIYCGKWELVGFAASLEKAEEKYKRWTEYDDEIVKLVDTKTNSVLKSQNC